MAPNRAPPFAIKATAAAEEEVAGAPVDVELPGVVAELTGLVAELTGLVAELEALVAPLEPPVVVAGVEAEALLGRVNETESVVVAVPVAEILAAPHSASSRAIAAWRSAAVQCSVKQAVASAWN